MLNLTEQEVNDKIMLSMFTLGKLFRDKIENFVKSAETLEKMHTRYGPTPYELDSYFYLYLDYMDLSNGSKMQEYKEKCSKILKKSDKQKIKEMICNDIQVWHMDNTFVFTPFKDFRLLELLNCELSVIVDQVTDGKLSKKLIEYFDPTLLKNIDAFKNINDPYWFN